MRIYQAKDYYRDYFLSMEYSIRDGVRGKSPLPNWHHRQINTEIFRKLVQPLLITIGT